MKWNDVVMVSAGLLVLFVAGLAANDAVAANATGSIKGTVEVSRVRSPENVLVYIEEAPGEYSPPEKSAAMNQAKLVFSPYVLPILKGTKVSFRNSDPILHNVFWPKSKDGSYRAHNLGSWGKGTAKEYTFEKPGSVVLLCNVHPEMEAHIVVLQNPFFVVVGKDGSYEISDVPPGEYSVKAWYPNPKKLRAKTADVTVTVDKAAELNFSLSRR